MKHQSGIPDPIKVPAIAWGLVVAVALGPPAAGCIPGGPRGEEGVPECDLGPSPAFFAVAFPEDDNPSHLTTFSGEVVTLGEDTCSSRQAGYGVVMGDEQRAHPGDSITLTVDDGSSCGALTLYIAGLSFDVALGDFVEVRAFQMVNVYELEVRKNGELLGYMVRAGVFPSDLNGPPEVAVASDHPSCEAPDDLLWDLRATRNGQAIEVAPSSFAELEDFIVVHRWTREYVGDALIVDAPARDTSFALVRR